jgi:hypothetical protein
MTEKLDFWYDAQIRRFLMQFTRVFTVLSYAAGTNPDGSLRILPIPARYASTDRMVASIQRNNSENSMLSVPMITIYLSDVEIDRSRTQLDEYVEKRQVYEREFDDELGIYNSNVGNTFTLERRMPVPLTLKINVDIWTSNMEQKLQIFEQLIILFNPAMDLQHSNNVFDWCALTIIEPESVNWSSRSVPIGTDSEIDILTMAFSAPIWISPPAKLKPQKIIHQIITNISDMYNMEGINCGDGLNWDSQDLMARAIHTPENYQLRVDGNTLTLLTSGGNETMSNGDVPTWRALLDDYGRFRPGISEIRLRYIENLEDPSKDIRGNISFLPEPNKLNWSIDPTTLPINTLDNINGVINPHSVFPGNGLPLPVNGQRYLLTDELGPNSQEWGVITAKRNDIIQYLGSNWVVAFTAAGSFDQQVVLNLASLKQLRWTGQKWVLAVDGDWLPGTWRIFL